MDELPIGAPVAGSDASPPVPDRVLQGQFVRIAAPDPQDDAAALYAATHGRHADPGQWTYMGYGPFDDAGSMQAWMHAVSASGDPLFRVVHDIEAQRPAGMASFMNCEPRHRTIELGHIWFTPAAQRSRIGTETLFLMLRECFERLGFRRVEWKCDALNARSRAAALRLGFSFEGIFRQHFIVKGRNRDTAWYAMLDGEWPQFRGNFERFLYDPDCTQSLREMNR